MIAPVFQTENGREIKDAMSWRLYRPFHRTAELPVGLRLGERMSVNHPFLGNRARSGRPAHLPERLWLGSCPLCAQRSGMRRSR